jgi:lysophospholipase L1-like esterase
MKSRQLARLGLAFGILLSGPTLAQGPAPTPPPAPGTPAAGAAGAHQIAFPGQWAPPLEGLGRRTNPKSCRGMKESERPACYEHTAYHWPGYDRYAAANSALAAIKPATRRGQERVVFMGDSITDNWSKAGYGGFFPGKPYVNRGIGGQTSGQMLVRFRPDVVALRPKVVVILAGTNDVSGNAGPLRPGVIEDNLSSMSELARANGIKVVLASLLPVADDKKDAGGKPILRTGDRPPETLRQLNAWIAEYARKNRHVFLDYHQAVADAQGALRGDLNNDGLHPNAAGYALMGALAEKAIATALRR